MLEALLDGLRRRDRRALARLITFAARGQHLDELRTLGVPATPSRVIALTGGGGVGKSTLVGKLIEELRRRNKTVAVLACDPQSPLTGGALLGDRFRMAASASDDGVFIRSLAALSGREAVAEHLGAVVRLCEHFGFDMVLIETVGAGQGDTAVRELADAVVLLLQPETGDDLQWEKAGVLEVADAVVIHKADLPGADRAADQVKSALELPGGRDVPVFLASSRTGQGIAELTTWIETQERRQREGDSATELLHEFNKRLRRPVAAGIIAEWRAGRITTDEALRRLLAQGEENNEQ